MLQHPLLHTALTVSIVVALLRTAPSRAQGPSKEDVKNLGEFLKGEISSLKAKDQQVQQKVPTLRRIETLVNRVVESAAAADPNSLAAAVIAGQRYREALQHTESAADALGLQLQRTDNVLTLVQQKEEQGTLPPGNIKPEWGNVRESARRTFEEAETAIAKARGESEEIRRGLTTKGVNVPGAGSGIPAGPYVVSFFTPARDGEVNRPYNGFVILANNDDNAIDGTLAWKVTGDGRVDPSSRDFTIPARGMIKLDFTVTVTTSGGRVSYERILTYRRRELSRE